MYSNVVTAIDKILRSYYVSTVPLPIHGDLQIEKLHSISTFLFFSPSKKNNQDLLTYVVVRSYKIKEKK